MNHLEKMEARLREPHPQHPERKKLWLYVRAHDLQMLIDYVRARETMCEGICFCNPQGKCKRLYLNARGDLLKR